MIKHLNHFTFVLLLGLTVFSLPADIRAEEPNSQSSPLFKFQYKLAMKGNAHAQYKLACMYEVGKGVKLNIEHAKHWYDMAYKDGMKAAGDRYTYLTVKEQGYDQANHSAWLEGVKTDAGAGKGDAMFLLGQLYREGLGVKKDLNKSQELLEQVSLLGDADVEDELALIQAEMAVNAKAKQDALKEREVKAGRLAQQQKEQQVELKVNKEQQIEHLAEAEKAKQAEKIRKYEKVMMKLKLEQQQIDEQQAWASGNDNSSTADDEI